HFTEAAQELFAANGLRPVDAKVLARHPDFAAVKLFSVDNWEATFAKHFADDGTFDRIYTQK
ncbi:MAG: sulfate ABC transporter substrate-binding protein, partial [Pseudomonadota bacterium]|nr:sulfate ABC transporter substrate-binding protein [Pseudomonadota bacterium]